MICPPGQPGVVAAIVTHDRPRELGRLLASLTHAGPEFLAAVISDHKPGGQTREIARSATFPATVLEDPSNPGPGTGWANAAKAALAAHGDNIRAIWYLDDDVVIPPGGLSVLCAEAERARLDAIAPLLEDQAGKVWAFPEPAPPALRGEIRRAESAGRALELLGPEPVQFCWCTGACFLVSVGAVGAAGFHRGDFWMLGEDLEYSMRVAAARGAGFTCKLSVPHLPAPPADPARAKTGELLKFCSLLQNLGYLSFHCPHSRHMKSYLPGNYRRFFRTFGYSPRIARLAWACFFGGSLCGEPAGGPRGRGLRDRIRAYGL